jgi:peptidyl-prolyl cis-trans isomerase D
MLQKLRDKTSGWIASVVLGLLTIPFAFFGVEQYMQQQNEDWVAKVQAPPTWWEGAPNVWPVSYLWTKEEISSRDWRQQLERARAEQRQQLGDNYDPQVFDTVDNKRAILEELIDQRVLRMASGRAGVAVSDAQVQKAILEIRRSRSTASSARSVTSSRSLRRTSRRRASRRSARRPGGRHAAARPQRFGIRHQFGNGSPAQAARRRSAVSWVQLPAPTPDNGPVSGKEIERSGPRIATNSARRNR